MVTLACPDTHNASNAALIEELTHCFEEPRTGQEGLAAFLEKREPGWRRDR